jgi:cold shock CspA family protein
MARSQNAFNKKEKEKKKRQKKKAKQERKEQRQAESGDSSLENMMAYVDEFGNIVDTPPDETEKEEVDAESIEIGIPKKEDEGPVIRQGRVAFFDEKKGFGFINEDGTRERYFVHMSNLKTPIVEGDKVTFEGQKGAKGMDAINVTIEKS